MKEGAVQIDALVSLTGFSLVGGPAYNDSKAAEETLALLDVPYIAAHPVEFQTLEQWDGSERGLLPVESTIMVAIPELDGATGPLVFGGRSNASGKDMAVHPERAAMLAARVAKLIALRRSQRAARKIGIVLFNFPPNAGNTGTAAYLSVFESLYTTLATLRREGYRVDVPDSVDTLREKIISGNAARFGAVANVHARIPASDHVRRERHLNEIEAQWGPAPGKQLSDGGSIFVLGERFGNCSSAFNRPSASRAIRCASCSRKASPRRTRSPPSIGTCARILGPMRCCTSARTARSNSCRASNRVCLADAGPTG